MKKVEAIIQPFKLDAVKEALNGAGIDGLTVSEVKGFGGEKAPVEAYRGGVHVPACPRFKIETLVDDHKATQIVEVIKRAARTGHVGDGKIFVFSVDEVVRIRTGERGSLAIR
jgi:nitrogen regulatory protein P-II 1